MSLVPLNPQTLAQHARGTQEVAVSTYLEQARSWLATAVEVTGPEQIAAAKAQIATAAEATKQLNLSKEIQLDAQEMVRRAEYALGKAIRRGQEEGSITQRGHVGPQSDYWRNGQLVRGSNRGADPDQITTSPKDLTTSGQELHEVYKMSDGIEPDEFDAVLSEAKAEGNVSRANVVRKIKAKAKPVTRDGRAAEMAELADQGYTSRQIAEHLGIGFEATRRIARDFDIDVPADRVVGKQRRIDHTQVVESTVTDLVNTAEFIEAHIDLSQVDFTEADEWVSSLTNSIRVLNRFVKQIKEKTHV